MEQPQAGAVLQSGEQAARRGLAHVQRLGRGGETSQFHDAQEEAEGLELHG
jgi:hypothetical protein